jgi:hypothetical protein
MILTRFGQALKSVIRGQNTFGKAYDLPDVGDKSPRLVFQLIKECLADDNPWLQTVTEMSPLEQAGRLRPSFNLSPRLNFSDGILQLPRGRQLPKSQT